MPRGSSSVQHEAIVDKLHGILSVYRRERDESHRAKELAEERLRLLQEERQHAEKKVHALKTTLQQLTEKVSAARQQEGEGSVAVLRKEVHQLTKEANFQHAELLSKREKLSHIKDDISKKRKVCESTQLVAQDTVRKQREKNMWLQEQDKRSKNNESMEQKLSKVVMQFDNDVYTAEENESWMIKWPRLVERKGSQISMEVTEIERKCNALKLKLEQYKKQFGIIVK